MERKKPVAKAAKKEEKKDAKPSGQKAPPPPSAPAVYKPNMVARGVGAGVCIFLAVLIGLGMLQSSAVVIDFLCLTVKGLVGYGFFLMLPVLVSAAVLLVFQRQKRVAARLWCLGLLPVFFGAFLHMFLSPYQYEIAPASLLLLWTDGRTLFGGGVIGGFLSLSFVKWFSKAGAGIFFALVLLFLLAVSYHLTPRSILARRKKRRNQREYDDYEDFDEPPAPPENGIFAEPYGLPFDMPPPPPPEPQAAGGSAPPVAPKKEPEVHLPQMEVEDSGLLPGLEQLGFSKGKRDSSEPSSSVTVREVEEEESAGGGSGLLKKSKRLLLGQEKVEGLWVEQRTHGEGSVPGREGGPVPPSQEPFGAQEKENRETATNEETKAIGSPVKKSSRQYAFPQLELLADASGEGAAQGTRGEIAGTRQRLEETLHSFGINGPMVGTVQGPSVTRYEMELEQGVRLSKITKLSDDVALSLGVSGVRIAPVPGKLSVVGVEVPNRVVTSVPIREVLASKAFQNQKSSAAFSVGKDIGGNYIVGDCAKLPHLLIAGTTGSGKSVCINSLIVSMLYKSRPEELRFIMVDPKMVELGGYNGIPHLLIPVVTDPKKAAGALQWAVTEMMKRYRLFSEAGVRELSSYNQWVVQRNRQPGHGGKAKLAKLPKVVIVIDELADLMLVAAKEVEESICRVAQMGRAAGMHLVIATQRPSADVITGVMKANIPSRIAFAVASALESRIILDSTGAEKLVGKGDMLWFPLGAGKPLRVQGCFISDEEVEAVVEEVKKNSGDGYDSSIMQEIERNVSEAEKKGKSSGGYPAGEDSSEGQDELFSAAVDVVLELGQASVSMLQRRLKLGYARAARLVDQMEQKGIVGPFEGSKPRQMLITKEQWESMKKESGGRETPAIETAVEENGLLAAPVPRSDGA